MIYTAHLSTERKPGAVFLVSRMYAGFAAAAMAYMICKKLVTIRHSFLKSNSRLSFLVGKIIICSKKKITCRIF